MSYDTRDDEGGPSIKTLFPADVNSTGVREEGHGPSYGEDKTGGYVMSLKEKKRTAPVYTRQFKSSRPETVQ